MLRDIIATEEMDETRWIALFIYYRWDRQSQRDRIQKNSL